MTQGGGGVNTLRPTSFLDIELCARSLTMAKRTEFVDRLAPGNGPDTKGCDPLATVWTIYRGRPIYEVSSFRHDKHYRNDLSDADKCW